MTINKKYFTLSILIAVFISFTCIQDTFAFDFTYQNKTYSINDNLKQKVNTFVSKNIKTKEKAKKYINALAKISYTKLSSEKQSIFLYLVYKIESFIALDVYILNNLVSNTKDYIEVDDKYVFSKNGKEYLLNIKTYYLVDFSKSLSTYIKGISNLKNEILFKKGESYFISKGGYSIEQKLTINELKSKVLFYSDSVESVLFQDFGDYYYAFPLYEYEYFEVPTSGIFLSQYNKIKDLSKVILFSKNGKYSFVFNFSPIKLFKKSLLDSISNKDKFLSVIGKDIYFYKDNDWEEILTSIKAKALELSNTNQTKDDKILSIYSWISKNIKYDSFSTSFVNGTISEKYYMENVDMDVFAGVGAYKNKNTVCDGYTKIFFYMAYFAGLEDTEIQTGKANIGNGTLIAHAWIKIGDYYYDPTWDSGLTGNSSFKWYKLSYDEINKTRVLK